MACTSTKAHLDEFLSLVIHYARARGKEREKQPAPRPPEQQSAHTPPARLSLSGRSTMAAAASRVSKRKMASLNLMSEGWKWIVFLQHQPGLLRKENAPLTESYFYYRRRNWVEWHPSCMFSDANAANLLSVLAAWRFPCTIWLMPCIYRPLAIKSNVCLLFSSRPIERDYANGA